LISSGGGAAAAPVAPCETGVFRVHAVSIFQNLYRFVRLVFGKITRREKSTATGKVNDKIELDKVRFERLERLPDLRLAVDSFAICIYFLISYEKGKKLP